MTRRALHAAQILWPAFLFAAMLELLVFAWVDPLHLRFGAWAPDARTVYSVTFLVLWAAISLAGGVSHWLMSQAVHGSAEGRSPASRRTRSTRHA